MKMDCEKCIYKHFPHDKWCYMFPDAPVGYCAQFKPKDKPKEKGAIMESLREYCARMEPLREYCARHAREIFVRDNLGNGWKNYCFFELTAEQQEPHIQRWHQKNMFPAFVKSEH